MNRYLFKAKRKDNNEWVYGDLLNLYDGRKYIVNNQFGACIDNKGNFINTEAPFTNEIIPETLCQCTGLQDRDCEDIFENDMLDGIYEDLYVSYCDKCKQLQLKYICNDECLACEGNIHWFEFIEDCNEYKIIGNKFDKEED